MAKQLSAAAAAAAAAVHPMPVFPDSPITTIEEYRKCFPIDLSKETDDQRATRIAVESKELEDTQAAFDNQGIFKRLLKRGWIFRPLIAESTYGEILPPVGSRAWKKKEDVWWMYLTARYRGQWVQFSAPNFVFDPYYAYDAKAGLYPAGSRPLFNPEPSISSPRGAYSYEEESKIRRHEAAFAKQKRYKSLAAPAAPVAPVAAAAPATTTV